MSVIDLSLGGIPQKITPRNEVFLKLCHQSISYPWVIFGEYPSFQPAFQVNNYKSQPQIQKHLRTLNFLLF